MLIHPCHLHLSHHRNGVGASHAQGVAQQAVAVEASGVVNGVVALFHPFVYEDGVAVYMHRSQTVVCNFFNHLWNSLGAAAGHCQHCEEQHIQQPH